MIARWKREFKGKEVGVIGLGVSNMALIKILHRAGAKITGRDQKSLKELGSVGQELKKLGVKLLLGKDYLVGLNRYDVVVVSPGVPRTHPELLFAQSQGRLESEMSIVFRLSQAPIYGITGSSGKTTTTSLVGEILRRSKISAFVGGNIGRPVINELEHFSSEHNLILELSSFQLEDLTQSPKGAMITNITENHLDWHLSMANYIGAKKNIYIHQGAQDFLILNYDDPLSAEMAAEARGQVYYFSLKKPVPRGTYLAGEDLIFRDGGKDTVFAHKSKLSLPGEHNVANFLGAALFSSLIGANWEVINEIGQSFKGVEHRLEFVREVAGVRYYNDSIATTPHRTQAALHSFSQPIILIAGGSDKNLSFKELGNEIHSRVKKLILLGATAPRIKEAVLACGDFPVEEVQNMEEAVLLATEQSVTGDIVLMSPACASFDQYPNFASRGAHFRDLVQNLPTTK